MDWGQTIATITSVLAVGVGLLAYITRQFNRITDQLTDLDNRVQNIEKHQVRFDERFVRIDDQLSQVDGRFDRVDARFLQIDGRFDQVDARFLQTDGRFDRVEARLDRLEERLEEGLQDVKGDLQNLGIEQARMLGFLEGRGVMGKAAPDAERAS
ncbi:MAG: hypothetical protein OXG60_12515 [Chloroflexi bacterium]|nr:hypothetical protein [Chloroflexota bacterium]